MSLADELVKLQQLRREGALSEEEFQVAKRALIAGGPRAAAGPAHPLRPSERQAWERLAHTAERKMRHEMNSDIIGGIIAVILFIVMIVVIVSVASDRPSWCDDYAIEISGC